MIDKNQLRDLIRDVLAYLDPEIPYSSTAVELLMLTAAAESRLGTYIKQVNGPARGIMQMEPATDGDIWRNYLAHNKDLRRKILLLMGVADTDALDPAVTNLAYQIAMARVHYRRVSEALPNMEGHPTEDAIRLASYWKDHYNTSLGKGSRLEAAKVYIELCI